MNALRTTMKGIKMGKMKEIHRLIEEEDFEELSMMIGVKLAEEYFAKYAFRKDIYDD